MTQTEQAQTVSQEGNKPQQQEAQAATPASKPPLLQLWYHEADLALLQPINPFWMHLQRRLSQVGTSIFSYPPQPTAPKCLDESSDYLRQKYQEDLEKYKQAKEEHERRNQATLARALANLERTVLLVPCVSPAFLEALDRDLAVSQELVQALENPRFQIMPIVIQPVETGPTFTMRPICSYAEGRERETAMKELVAVMEKTLCDTLHMEPRTTSLDYLFCSPQTIQPVIEAEKTTMERVLNALEPVKHLVEQVNTQIVEARQLAIAERSEHQTGEALASQMETLRQQVQAQPTGWWSRWRKRQG